MLFRFIISVYGENSLALIYVLIINYRLLSGKEYRSHQSVFYERETGPSEQL